MFDGIAKALLGTIGTGVRELFVLFVSQLYAPAKGWVNHSKSEELLESIGTLSTARRKQYVC
jgi:hypothetical protein